MMKRSESQSNFLKNSLNKKEDNYINNENNRSNTLENHMNFVTIIFCFINYFFNL